MGRHSLQITGDDLIGRILSEAMLKGSTLRRERVFIGWTIRLRKELPPIDFRVESRVRRGRALKQSTFNVISDDVMWSEPTLRAEIASQSSPSKRTFIDNHDRYAQPSMEASPIIQAQSNPSRSRSSGSWSKTSEVKVRFSTFIHTDLLFTQAGRVPPMQKGNFPRETSL